MSFLLYLLEMSLDLSKGSTRVRQNAKVARFTLFYRGNSMRVLVISIFI